MFGLLGAGLGLLGGLMGGDNEQTQTRQLDPRLSNYVFGSDDKSGLLGDASRLYGQQMATGGLNDIQRQGLGMQQQYLMSPQYQQGNQSLYNLGMNLMGGGIAGNPFMQRGGMSPMGMPMGGRPQMTQPQAMQQPSQGFQYQPIQVAAPDYSAKPPEKPSVTSADFEKWYLNFIDRRNREEERRSGGG